MTLILISFFASFAVSIITTLILIQIAPKLGLVDNPKVSTHPAKLHKRPIPTGAGIALWASTVPIMLTILPKETKFLGIAAGVTMAAVVGVLDDKLNINPYIRLILNFVTAAVIVGAGVGITFITNPFNGIIKLDTLKFSFNFLNSYQVYPIAAGFALLWIVFVANMVNWSSGVDGQIPGVVIITAVILALLSSRFLSYDSSQIQLIKLSMILAGSAAGFLIFNWHPAKIFPGYGVTVWGVLIATLAILAGAKVATAILILALPLADGVISIVRRVIAGKSPVWADRGHLHHLLLDKGLPQPTIALLYWITTGILGYLALNLSSSAKAFAAILVSILVVGTVLWLKLILTEK